MGVRLSLIQREPVRVYVYTVLVAVVAILVVYGILDSEQAPLWLALAAAVVSVPAVEGARAKVTPTAKHRQPLGG